MTRTFARVDVASVAVSVPDDVSGVVLDHAGPASSRGSLERALAVDAVLDPVSKRRARAMTDDEWRATVSDYARCAGVVRAAGKDVVVAVCDDGLLHQALSPLLSPSQPERVLSVLRACAPCDVMLVVEDLAPGGLDATAGIAFAQQAVVTAQAMRVYATAGTAWLPRAAPLASASWLIGRIDAEVWRIVHQRQSGSRLVCTTATVLGARSMSARATQSAAAPSPRKRTV